MGIEKNRETGVEEEKLPHICPVCRKAGGLTITRTLCALPVGSFSLAGAQMKTSAQERPRLNCVHCGLEMLGVYDTEDGKQYAVFDPKDLETDGK